MVIIVPALAHADEPGEPHIVALRRCSFDDPALATSAVGKMADQPVAGYANTDANGNAPHNPAPAADGKEQHRPRQLLPHPGPFDNAIEWVVRQRPFRAKPWRPLQHQFAVQLPPGVVPEPPAMAE